MAPRGSIYLSAVSAVLAFAGPAAAARVSVEGDLIRIVAGPGEENRIDIPGSINEVRDYLDPGLHYRFQETTDGNLVAGSGCVQDDARTVLCHLPSSQALPRLEVDLGDGDDQTFAEISNPATIRGFGGSFSSTAIEGGTGDDSLIGTESADEINTGSGEDVANAGKGTDFVLMGPGDDRYLGFGVDDHAGDLLAETFVLGAGDDYMENAGASAETKYSANVLGGSGRDRLNLTSPGQYYVHAGGGNDRVNVRDGDPTDAYGQRDSVVCEAGRQDLIRRDRRELAVLRCEEVRPRRLLGDS